MNFIARPSGFFAPDLNVPFKCALGKGGLKIDKHEGDQASPIGTWEIVNVLFRPDKGPKPTCHFPISEITLTDGWCDAPEHPNYNQQVKLPFEDSHEELWREDDIYDIIVVLNHNLQPAIPFGGSAIFMHIAREDFSGTAGCVALNRENLEYVLTRARPGDTIEIKP